MTSERVQPAEQRRTSDHAPHASSTGLAIGALGVVFGDIGTSPLYALKESLSPEHGLTPGPANVLGVLSLIVWSLTMVVTVKYLAFVLRADNRGEGGIFALFALLPRRLRSPPGRRQGILAILVIVGAALLYGDGAITPAISVLSAVEGLSVATSTFNGAVLPITLAILVGLFTIQRYGTAGIGQVFGPVMIVWFVTIGLLGLFQVVRHPGVLRALSPTYAVAFFVEHGRHGLLVLGSVFLAVTGGEALYADMGHFGRQPIRRAWWFLVKGALVLCYLGQGALLLRNPEVVHHPFFALVPRGAATIALVVLSTAATVIASQALISGAFSLTRQAVQLGYLPRLAIKHTSYSTEGQIYVPVVNWALALACVVIVLAFRRSTNLAAAYGIAVTGTMAITSLLYFAVMRHAWGASLGRSLAILLLFLAFDLPFLGANLLKLFQGGYVPILLGAALTVVMIIWKRGGRLLSEYQSNLKSPDRMMPRLLERVKTRVPGTAVFMVHRPAGVAALLVHYVSRIQTLHEKVVLLTMETEPVPLLTGERRLEIEDLGQGVWAVVGRHGFMEETNVPRLLQAAVRTGRLPVRLDDVTYFLGRETFMATERGQMGRVSESIFAFLVRNATPADRHFQIPPERVVELGTQVDL
jgi:KUP system potassium uptake protein